MAPSSTIPDEFIFKGGTSLSKAYGLIERFSEGIDILVRERDGEAKNARYKRIEKMTADTAAAVGDPGSREKVSAERTGLHRTELLHYGPNLGVPALMLSRIRLDIGVAGGIKPHGARSIGTLVGDVIIDQQGIDLTEFDDLAPFELPVLHPGRTLVEKLLLVHTAATRSVDRLDELGAHRAGRHFYDIHCLLGHDESCALLSDRQQFAQVLDDAVRVSTEHFGGVELRPADGFAASEAFCAQEQLGDALAREYRETMDVFYFGAEPYPPFQAVCERVEERRELL